MIFAEIRQSKRKASIVQGSWNQNCHAWASLKEFCFLNLLTRMYAYSKYRRKLYSTLLENLKNTVHSPAYYNCTVKRLYLNLPAPSNG
jgi:hypothetical protein